MNILIIGSNDTKNSPTAFSPSHLEKIKQETGSKVTLASSELEINQLLPTTDVLIFTAGGFYPFSKLNLEAAFNLKWVQTTSAGVTDIAAALRTTQIHLTNASGVHPIPISEYVLGVMLAFAKRFDRTFRHQFVDKRWVREYEELKGFELNGKTAGIVGFGRIGQQIGKVLNAIGMNVVTLSHNKEVKSENVKHVYKNIDELLKNSDFVIDCLPLAPSTTGYFDMDKFKQMRPDSYFINIGRGGTVAEKDLIKALQTNIIAGAALDVFETEPLPDNSPLWSLENVILTPHSSSWIPNYIDRVIDIFLINLAAFKQNEPMPTTVDKALGY